MINLYEDIKSKDHYNKFEIGGLLFAEYKCPLEEKFVGIWTHTDYLVHVVSGKKTWHTTEGSFTAEAGQSLYFKKGAAIVEQFFNEEFCLLLFFVPDDFIRSVVKEYAAEMKDQFDKSVPSQSTVRVNNDAALNVFFQSMMTYFSGVDQPSEALLKLKLKELILSILVSRSNPELSNYFRKVAAQDSPMVSEIMESNFRYNLSLENFAELCHKSLSSFKREFQKQYNETPGRWLLNKRLEYSAVLLRNNHMNISQIVFESGFEDLSHFSRAFKSRFGLSPTQFRNQPISQH
ncbi:MAG: helix-turn-helix transcriptional regulator [bacterium]|nr:helix-turn-helix transcriptional regulator [bacterium]